MVWSCTVFGEPVNSRLVTVPGATPVSGQLWFNDVPQLSRSKIGMVNTVPPHPLISFVTGSTVQPWGAGLELFLSMACWPMRHAIMENGDVPPPDEPLVRLIES